MKKLQKLLSAAVVAAGAGTVSAQFPALVPPTAGSFGTPGLLGTAPPAGLPQGIAPYPAKPEGPTIWSKLGISNAQMEYCRRTTCQTPFGQLMGRVVSPLSSLSGGLIKPFCPTTPTLAELLDPGPVGAAAKVKQDRAAAEQRMKAIQYLGGVDCHYWPEAEEALIGAMRNDKNECVRYTAAKTLATGCCCTAKVIVALSHVVSCSDKDNAPWEKSARVRSAAAAALERCLGSPCCAAAEMLPEAVPVPGPATGDPATGGGSGKPTEGGGGGKDKKDDDKKDDKKSGTAVNAAWVAPAEAKPGPSNRNPAEPLTFAEYYHLVPKVPMGQVVSNARRSLDIGRRIGFTPTEEINATDYAAAGLPSAGSASAMSRKPTSLLGALTQTDAPAEAPTVVPARVVAKAPAAAVYEPTPAPRMAAPPMKLPPLSPAPQPTVVPVKVMPTAAKAPPMPVLVPVTKAVPAKPIPVKPAPIERIAPVAPPIAIPMPPAPIVVPTIPQSAPPVMVPVVPAGVPADPVPLYRTPLAPPSVANPYGYR